MYTVLYLHLCWLKKIYTCMYTAVYMIYFYAVIENIRNAGKSISAMRKGLQNIVRINRYLVQIRSFDKRRGSPWDPWGSPEHVALLVWYFS